MKITIATLAALAFAAVSLNAAESDAKDAVTKAAKQLADKPNYSWKTTVEVLDDSQFRPGPTEGKTEKDGLTVITSSFGDNTSQTVLKGDKGALTNQDGAWQSLAEAENEEGFGRFRAMFARSFKAPAAQAAEIAGAVKELKKDGDTYIGELTEEGAKNLVTFFRRGNDGPTVSNAKASVKFWIKDGLLSKYEYKAKGTINFNGNDMARDRVTTVEIKDIGSTKISIPDEAKKKLS